MRWRNKTDTNIDDCKIISRGANDFSLLKATKDGYVELARGKYEDVRTEYEQAYNNITDTLYGHLKKFRAE